MTNCQLHVFGGRQLKIWGRRDPSGHYGSCAYALVVAIPMITCFNLVVINFPPAFCFIYFCLARLFARSADMLTCLRTSVAATRRVIRTNAIVLSTAFAMRRIVDRCRTSVRDSTQFQSQTRSGAPTNVGGTRRVSSKHALCLWQLTYTCRPPYRLRRRNRSRSSAGEWQRERVREEEREIQNASS